MQFNTAGTEITFELPSPWAYTTDATCTITTPWNGTQKPRGTIRTSNSTAVYGDATSATIKISSSDWNKFRRGDGVCYTNTAWPDISTPTSSDCSWDQWQDAWTTAPSCYTIRPKKTPAEMLKEVLKSRQAPLILGASRKSLSIPTDIREVRARETLHRVIGDQKFRNFLKNGFITVRAKSGLTYQIFPDYKMTHVYKDGKHSETLCVVMRGNFPPTDSLIARYLMILDSEDDFRKLAISHQVGKKVTRRVTEVDSRPLVEIYNDLKAAS